jgi:uncharacterized protein RhaS with RHS repeats
MYSPTLGRFIQPDPIGYGGGVNLYAYVHNDPLNFTDPLGLCDNPQGCGGGSFQIAATIPGENPGVAANEQAQEAPVQVAPGGVTPNQFRTASPGVSRGGAHRWRRGKP